MRIVLTLLCLTSLHSSASADYIPDPLPIYNPQPAPDQYEDVVSISYRAPHGHTHTCGNGHTWDHDENPSHHCRHCQLSQYVQDSVPRPVMVVTRQRVKVKSSATTTTAIPPIVHASPVPLVAVKEYDTPTFSPQPFQSLSSGGCASGSCSSGSSRVIGGNGGILGFGLFGRRR